MVVREGLRLGLVGVVQGVAASMTLSRLIAAFLYGVRSWNPPVFATVPLVHQ